eukprot:6174866-Pleurochrysis_carterae.AAC.2
MPPSPLETLGSRLRTKAGLLCPVPLPLAGSNRHIHPCSSPSWMRMAEKARLFGAALAALHLLEDQQELGALLSEAQPASQWRTGRGGHREEDSHSLHRESACYSTQCCRRNHHSALPHVHARQPLPRWRCAFARAPRRAESASAVACGIHM